MASKEWIEANFKELTQDQTDRINKTRSIFRDLAYTCNDLMKDAGDFTDVFQCLLVTMQKVCETIKNET